MLLSGDLMLLPVSSCFNHLQYIRHVAGSLQGVFDASSVVLAKSVF